MDKIGAIAHVTHQIRVLRLRDDLTDEERIRLLQAELELAYCLDEGASVPQGS
jgi:hypothetical protein